MASEKILASKKEKVAALAELLKNSCSGALVDYEGITVEEDTKLRREMRENNVQYFVEKEHHAPPCIQGGRHRRS